MLRTIYCLLSFTLCCLPLNAYAFDSSDLSVGMGLLLFISIVISLICREIVCWYFKLNEVVSLLKEIRDSLNKNRRPTPYTEKQANLKIS